MYVAGGAGGAALRFHDAWPDPDLLLPAPPQKGPPQSGEWHAHAKPNSGFCCFSGGGDRMAPVSPLDGMDGGGAVGQPLGGTTERRRVERAHGQNESKAGADCSQGAAQKNQNLM